MSVVRWRVVHPVVGGRGWRVVVPLVYECCKMMSGIFCGWGRGWGIHLGYECCKMMGGTSCGWG